MPRLAAASLVLAGCAAAAPVPASLALLGTAPPVPALTAPPREAPAPDPGAAPAEDPADAGTARAMDALVARDFAGVGAAFDPASEPTEDEIAAVWALKTRGIGALVRWEIVDRTRQDGFAVRLVRLEHQRGELVAVATLTTAGRIASLFFAPPAPPAPYIDRARFREVPITVGEADPLPGTLALPTGPGPFPAVVLIHGSGPNDRDSAIGANKPFADLAAGLATAGIASLRYDKRTFAHPDRLPDPLTLDNEVVDDAVLAVHRLAARPEVDAHRVFVVGHSLGGLLAPEIAVRAGGVAGIALLAPPARRPWDLVRAQLEHLRAPPALRAEVERAVISVALGGEPPMLGMPFSYWRDWDSRDGVAMVRALGRPTLILHGDRDYQVVAEDLAIWRAGLGARATFATLPGDNHLFIRGTGRSMPQEYKLPGHVDPRVIAYLVAFVHQRK